MGEVVLAKGRVRPVWAGHPWVFAQAVKTLRGAPAPGDPVRVLDDSGRFLGSGFWSPASALVVRIASRTDGEALDQGWLARRIDAAATLRRSLGFPSTRDTGYRLINAEGDSLPGLIVDVYGDTATVLFGTIGMWRLAEDVYAHVQRVTGAKRVIALAADRKAHEEFTQAHELVRGEESDALRFVERGLSIEIPNTITQKTGYYFDQREQRARVEQLALGRDVLDAFAFIGSFGLAAARGGARSVLSVDSSVAASTAGVAVSKALGFSDRHEFLTRDAKQALPELARAGRRFGLVVVDPPKLVPSARHLERGREAYRKLNQNALALVQPGGILVSCSCSAAMRAEDFLRTLSTAAADVGRSLSLLHLGQQAPDHPVPPAFSEGMYLKTAFLSVS
ncbi:MAG: class I SAM-dependent rRNA methyltransferase [Polyangiales bacterium]|nr:class I SAM-dependent rRNA methyltransferase [Myxococcales bacterium]MCB9658720.1 class I SAM-dependent rRNA methyltransferase [Sandaracinaceae bacterium]